MLFTYERIKSGRIRLLADGEVFLTVREGFFAGLDIPFGADVSQDDIFRITDEYNKAAALNKALRLITVRMHSRAELITKLQRDFEKAHAQDAADKASEMGLVDDFEFSQMLSQELFCQKGYARRRIIDELRHRGVDAQTAEAAVVIDEESEKQRLCQLLEACPEHTLAVEKERKRLVNTLIRKGYSIYKINEALGGIAVDEEQNFY